jgi:hypothetical protein
MTRTDKPLTLRHTVSRLLLAAVAVAAATAIAACGGSKPPSGSAGSHTSGAGPVAEAYKHSACMRSHGVPNFPDPQVHDGGTELSIHITPGITSAPAFKSAQQVCARYLPEGGANVQSASDQRAHTEAMLAFARCLRGHGFPRFPDPTAQGDLNLSMITAAGINLHQPALLRAGFACVGVTHGDITRADVEQAVNGPPGQTTQSSASGESSASGG